MAKTTLTLPCSAPEEEALQAAAAVLRRAGFVTVLRQGRPVWRRGIEYLIPLQYIQVTHSPGGLELQIWTLEQFFGDRERDLEHSAPPLRKKLNQLLEELQAELSRLHDPLL